MECYSVQFIKREKLKDSVDIFLMSVAEAESLSSFQQSHADFLMQIKFSNYKYSIETFWFIDCTYQDFAIFLQQVSSILKRDSIEGGNESINKIREIATERIKMLEGLAKQLSNDIVREKTLKAIDMSFSGFLKLLNDVGKPSDIDDYVSVMKKTAGITVLFVEALLSLVANFDRANGGREVVVTSSMVSFALKTGINIGNILSDDAKHNGILYGLPTLTKYSYLFEEAPTINLPGGSRDSSPKLGSAELYKPACNGGY